jgi:DNA repair exonuclease SbcCD ATPase subunit
MMFQALNDRLAELRGKARRKANWERRGQELTKELERKRHERAQWEEQLRAERKDVDRLTGISLGALFYTLIGKREEKLSVEETEALQTKLKFEEAADTVVELEQELEELQRSLSEVRFIEADIQAALEEKTRMIHDAHPTLADELQALTDQEAEAQANAKELREAVSAGRSVASALEQAREHLGSAKNWGTYDMFGGGAIAGAVKHSRIDDARSAIHHAQRSLRRFQTELLDVQRDLDLRIDIGEMLTFADFFFDGFIADWMVQGRIQESLDQISLRRSRLTRVVADLEAELRKAEASVEAIRGRRAALIENA